MQTKNLKKLISLIIYREIYQTFFQRGKQINKTKKNNQVDSKRTPSFLKEGLYGPNYQSTQSFHHSEEYQKQPPHTSNYIRRKKILSHYLLQTSYILQRNLSCCRHDHYQGCLLINLEKYPS